MPERTAKLQATLEELHRELAEAGTLDAGSRAMLEAMAREIQSSLANPPDAKTQDPEDSGLTDRLRETALRLENEHPQVAAVVGRLLDTLASLGI